MNVYELNYWADAPESYRAILENVEASSWIPLNDALETLAKAPPPKGLSLREWIARRCAQGLMAAKAGLLEETYDDSGSASHYKNMPITQEWKSEPWLDSLADHWEFGEIKTTGRAGPNHRLLYQDIELNRDDVEAAVQLLESHHNTGTALMTQAEIERWIYDWFSAQAAGASKSENAVWQAFKEVKPGHNREDFFRPAFREVKKSKRT